MTWPTKTDFVDGDVLTAAQVNNIGTNLNLYDPTSATSGQVPVADGAGSVAWGSAGGMSVITSGNLPTGSGTVTFSSIPQTYKKLIFYINDYRVATNGANLKMTINNNTGTVYRSGWSYVNSGGYTGTSGNYIHANICPLSQNSSYDQQSWVEIDQYTETSYQNWKGQTGGYDTGGNSFTSWGWGVYYGTPAAVTRVDIGLSTGNWTSGTYTLYGVS